MRQAVEAIRRTLGSEHGVAFPLGLIGLLVLMALIAAFAVLSSSEPQIAANHIRAAQARALAEAGLERAIWALNNPTESAGIPDPLPALASALPPPFNGTAISLGAGVFAVSVTNGSAANERNVTAEGFVPTQSAYRAKRKISATVTTIGVPDPPCALCVKGTLDVGGNSTIDARGSTCGTKVGAYSTGATNISGSGDVYGGGNNSPDEPGVDYLAGVAPSAFDAFTFTQDELNILKSLAKANNAYYKGAVSFGSSNLLPNGIVFVDTVSGNPIGTPPTPSDLASVTITGSNASGWLIVMGSISINGNIAYHGLVYAANDIVYHASGSGGGITGAVISLNLVTSVSSSVDASTTGNASISYNCDDIKNGRGTIPQGYFVKPGTWRELEG